MSRWVCAISVCWLTLRQQHAFAVMRSNPHLADLSVCPQGRFQLPHFLRPVTCNPPWLGHLIERANVCLAKRHGAYHNLGDGRVITEHTPLGLACLVSRTVGTGLNLSWKGYQSVWRFQRQLSWCLPCNDRVTTGIMQEGVGSCSLSSTCLLHYMVTLSAHLM